MFDVLPAKFAAEVHSLLTMAKAGTANADVPAELSNARDFCMGKYVAITASTRIGWTAANTVRKKAHELKPGDVIQTNKEDKDGYRVATVNVWRHQVAITGTGQDHTRPYAGEVTVFAGPKRVDGLLGTPRRRLVRADETPNARGDGRRMTTIGIRRMAKQRKDYMWHDQIPLELRELDRWACWRETAAGKPPIRADIEFRGRLVYAKTDDPATWASFDTALRYWQENLQGGLSGLSVALNGDSIVGIDLDDCRNPKTKDIDDWAVKIIKRFATYTELSPSGNGIRMFLRGELPAHGRHKEKIEVYDSGKFLSVTGRKLKGHGAGSKIEDRAAELLAWHREVFGDGSRSTTSTIENSNGQLVINDPPELSQSRLNWLFQVKPKARDLYEGTPNGHASQSEVDLALANYATAAGLSAQQTCDLLVGARHNAGEPIKPVGYFKRTIAKASNGKPHSQLGEELARQLRSGTDEITIGSQLPSGDEKQAGSMADVAKLIDSVRYLVRDWIPFGMVTMLLGEPGVGKSAFALYGLVRPIIMPCDWFTHLKGPAKSGNVLLCDTEGSGAITTKRNVDWGLPAERIMVPFRDDPLLSINLACAAHLEQIEAVIGRHQIRLGLIDSLRGAHDGDENNSRVVQVMQSLAKIAERTGAAIVIIHHTRKLMVDEEITPNASRGSNAIMAMVRAQLGIDKPDKGSDWCRLQMLKENLGLRPKAIGFRVTSKGLEFGEAPQRPKKESAKDRAEAFLLASMKPGQQCKAASLIEDARQQGISEDALLRARTELGIKAAKVKDGWEWLLPKR